MFKKIEIWILYLALLASIIFAVGFGFLVRQELVGGTKFGMLSRGALFLAEIPTTLKAAVNSGDPLRLPDIAPGTSGFLGESLDSEVYLLLTRFDGNIRESVVELIDLRDFSVLHSWNPDFDEIFSSVDGTSKEFENLLRDDHDNRAEIRHPLLTEDGGLIIHAEHSPLIKVDKCSELVWMNAEEQFHHSVELDHENRIWVPTSAYPYLMDALKVDPDTADFMDDSITRLDSDGNILYTKSVASILLAHGMEHLVFPLRDGLPYPFRDPIHLNDIQPVLEDGRHWKAGDLFLSLRHQSMVVLYRPSTEKVIWVASGDFNNQHDIDILDDGVISIYDNNLKMFSKGPAVDASNRILLYDFDNNTYESIYERTMVSHSIATETQGLNERLADKSMLIVNSNYGQTFFFDFSGKLKWRHINRGRDGNVYYIGWHRILHTDQELENVRRLLSSKECNNV